MKPLHAALLALSLLSSACSSWLPAEHRAPARLTEAPISTQWVTGSDDWPTQEWWRKYGDGTLDSLIVQALLNAPSIATAEARFNNARESVRITAASAGLRINAESGVSRQRLSDNGLFPTQLIGFSWYTQADLGLRASYSFDWWHKQQAATNAALATARAAQVQRSAATLALAAAIADSYFGWQADQQQLSLLDAQLQLAIRRQYIVAARIRAELTAADEQYQLDSELAGLRARRAGAQASAELRRVLIASLLGTGVDQLPLFTPRPLPAVDTHLPETVRIDLLARRPDVVASRWNISAAEQNLRSARAQFMPDVSINALAALSSVELGKLLEFGSRAPQLGAAIHLPIFDSGLLKAQYGVRAAQLDAEVANYNATVVTATREVATQAINLQQLGAQRELGQAQLDAAQHLLDATEARHTQGLSDGRPALLAAQAVQQQRAELSNVAAATLSADINLQLALGGGYNAADADHAP